MKKVIYESILASVLAYLKSAPQSKKALVQWFPNQAIHENPLENQLKKIHIITSLPRTTEFGSVGVGPHHHFKGTDSNAVCLF